MIRSDPGIDDRTRGVRLREIGGDDVRADAGRFAFARQLAELALAARDQDEVVLVRGEDARQLETDPARRSGDEGGHFR
jgi:hypothetical protein